MSPTAPPKVRAMRGVAAPDWLDFFTRIWAQSTLDARSSSAASIRASSRARDLQIAKLRTYRTVCVGPETSYPRRYRASPDNGCRKQKSPAEETGGQGLEAKSAGTSSAGSRFLCLTLGHAVRARV